MGAHMEKNVIYLISYRDTHFASKYYYFLIVDFLFLYSYIYELILQTNIKIVPENCMKWKYNNFWFKLEFSRIYFSISIIRRPFSRSLGYNVTLYMLQNYRNLRLDSVDIISALCNIKSKQSQRMKLQPAL